MSEVNRAFIDETLIQFVSRAMIEALGKDPEEIISDDGVSVPRWEAAPVRREALKQIAAFRAISTFDA